MRSPRLSVSESYRREHGAVFSVTPRPEGPCGTGRAQWPGQRVAPSWAAALQQSPRANISGRWGGRGVGTSSPRQLGRDRKQPLPLRGAEAPHRVPPLSGENPRPQLSFRPQGPRSPATVHTRRPRVVRSAGRGALGTAHSHSSREPNRPGRRQRLATALMKLVLTSQRRLTPLNPRTAGAAAAPGARPRGLSDKRPAGESGREVSGFEYTLSSNFRGVLFTEH